MRLLVLGDDRTVRGFALAGLPGKTCRDRSELASAMRDARRERDVALVLVSAAVAGLDPRLVEAESHRVDPPFILVLPGGPGTAGAFEKTP